MEALEADEIFTRARRTEVGASITAVPFYLKLGYAFKNGVTDATNPARFAWRLMRGKLRHRQRGDARRAVQYE